LAKALAGQKDEVTNLLFLYHASYETR
jgi:hypothetical protein